MNKTVLETMEAAATGPFAGKARNILGSFLFSGDAVDKKVSVLSGGEKARLAMALLLLKPANLLVLDEPTNHLDMRSKDILKEALINYTGTLVLVSHDRDFLDGICNRVFEFRDHKIKEYPMGVKEYLSYRKLNDFKALETQQKQKKEQQQKAEPKQVAPVEQKNYAEQKEIEKEQRKKQNRLSKVENLIAELETEQAQIEAKLSDSEIFKDTMQSNALLKRFDEVKVELEKLMEEWESLSV
jgi:ATP-binding cassette subfamily F protein 3